MITVKTSALTNYTTGTYDVTIPNGVCIDTVRLHLTINTPVETDTTVTACGSFTWNRTGLTYTTSGSYDYTFANGTCIDTVRLHRKISNVTVTDTRAEDSQTCT